MEIRRVGTSGVPAPFLVRAEAEQVVSLAARTTGVSRALAADVDAGVNVVAPPVKVVRQKKRATSENPTERQERQERGSRLDRRG